MLNELIKIRSIEDNMYKKYNLTIDKCEIWIRYLLKTKFNKDSNLESEDLYENIIDQNYNNKSVIRVLKRLEYIKNVIFVKLFMDFNISNNKTNYIFDKVKNSIEYDVLNCYLYFLQEYIDKEKNMTIKNQLIKTKYNIIFTNKVIFYNLISNGFMAPNDLYITSDFWANLLQFIDEVYYPVKNAKGIVLWGYAGTLVEMPDSDYNDLSKRFTSILKQCFLKSAFMIMDEDTIAQSNDKFHELIDSKEFIVKYPNNSISINSVIDCFNSMKKNKTKAYTLSFGYKKV